MIRSGCLLQMRGISMGRESYGDEPMLSGETRITFGCFVISC